MKSNVALGVACIVLWALVYSEYCASPPETRIRERRDPGPIWVDPEPREPWAPVSDCILVKPEHGQLYHLCPKE